MTAKEEQLREQLDVVLALALDGPQTAIPCPQEEELVAWHEGTLTASRREEVAAHLASCTSCYLVWSDLAMVAELPEFVQAPATEQRDRVQEPLLARFVSLFRPSVWAFGGIGTAMAAAMLVLILLPTLRIKNIEKNIDSAFSSLSGTIQSPLLPSQQPQLSIPEYQSKSFDFPSIQTPESFTWQALTPHQQAFAVGVADGMRGLASMDSADAALLNKLPNSVTMQPPDVSQRAWKRRQAALVHAGRWIVLLNVACSQPSSLSVSFQKDQEGILKSLTKEISAYPERDKYTLFFDSWTRTSAAEKDMCGRAKALLAMGLEQ